LTNLQKVGNSVMPAKAGIQNYLKLLDSRYRIKSGTGPSGMTLKEILRLFTKPSILMALRLTDFKTNEQQPATSSSVMSSGSNDLAESNFEG
jgi:hypothetical protein